MLQLAEYFPGYPSRLWYLAKQMGIGHAVGPLPREEHGMKPWDYVNLLQMKRRFDDFGLNLTVIESAPETNKIKLGLPGRDEQIDIMRQLITNMGAAGIPVLCYNFMAQFGWFRTSTTIRTRGGALVSGYDHSLLTNAPLTEAGLVSEDELWSNLKYYLDRIVPAAEKAKVKLRCTLMIHPYPRFAEYQGF
jgi:mannonate dehydratase